MQRLAYGCGPIPTGRRGYFENHTALEVTETYADLVSGDTLHAWRKEAGRDFVMVMHAHRYLSIDPVDEPNAEGPLGHPTREHGFLQPTEANRALWERVDAQARALHANVVLIRTPAVFTPTRKNIENLGRFRREIIGEVPYKICWEPRGLWDDEELVEIAEEYQMMLSVDPYVEFEFGTPPAGDVLYSLRQPRGRSDFDRDDIDDLIDFFEEHEGQVLAIFRGSERRRNAEAFGAEVRRRQADAEGSADVGDNK